MFNQNDILVFNQMKVAEQSVDRMLKGNVFTPITKEQHDALVSARLAQIQSKELEAHDLIATDLIAYELEPTEIS